MGKRRKKTTNIWIRIVTPTSQITWQIRTLKTKAQSSISEFSFRSNTFGWPGVCQGSIIGVSFAGKTFNVLIGQVIWSLIVLGNRFELPFVERTNHASGSRPSSLSGLHLVFLHRLYITSTRISQFCAMAEHAVIVKLSPLCSGEPVGACWQGISCRSPIIHALMLCQWRASKWLYTKRLRWALSCYMGAHL